MKSVIRDRNTLTKKNTYGTRITAGTGVTVTTEDYKAGVYVSKFTFADKVQAVANANLSFGWELGTLPKANVLLLRGQIDITYVSSVANTVVCEVGLGTVVGSGANATIGAVGATSEDYLDGTNATAFNGTTPVNYELNFTGENDVRDGASTAKKIFFNVAGNFTGVTGNVTYGGTVTIVWAIAQ